MDVIWVICENMENFDKTTPVLEEEKTEWLMWDPMWDTSSLQNQQNYVKYCNNYIHAALILIPSYNDSLRWVHCLQHCLPHELRPSLRLRWRHLRKPVLPDQPGLPEEEGFHRYLRGWVSCLRSETLRGKRCIAPVLGKWQVHMAGAMITLSDIRWITNLW